MIFDLNFPKVVIEIFDFLKENRTLFLLNFWQEAFDFSDSLYFKTFQRALENSQPFKKELK
jgi:hypothetical protein